MAMHGPCTIHGRVPSTRSSLQHVYTAVYGRERTGYTNVPGTRPCTGHVPCTLACLRFQPMNTVLFTAVYGPCTRPCMGRVHGREEPFTPYTAVFAAHVYGRPRHGPCTWTVHDPNTAVYTAVYEVVHGVYGPCTPRRNAYQASHKLTTEICWTAITQIQ